MIDVDDQKTKLSELISAYSADVADCGDAREVEEVAWQLLMFDAIHVAQERARPDRAGYPYHGMGIISHALDCAIDEMHAEAAEASA